MSNICLKDHMNNVLILLSLLDMHPKLTPNITLINVMDYSSRSRCVHAYANPLDMFKQLES